MGNKLKLFAALLGVACGSCVRLEVCLPNGEALGSAKSSVEELSSVPIGMQLDALQEYEFVHFDQVILELARIASLFIPDGDRSFIRQPDKDGVLSFVTDAIHYHLCLIQEEEGLFRKHFYLPELPKRIWFLDDGDECTVNIECLPKHIVQSILKPTITDCEVDDKSLLLVRKNRITYLYTRPIYRPGTFPTEDACDGIGIKTDTSKRPHCLIIGNICIYCKMTFEGQPLTDDLLKEKCVDFIYLRIPFGYDLNHYIFPRESMDTILRAFLPQHTRVVIKKYNELDKLTFPDLPEIDKIKVYLMRKRCIGLEGTGIEWPPEVQWKDFCDCILSKGRK